jgi:hypothetical protein
MAGINPLLQVGSEVMIIPGKDKSVSLPDFGSRGIIRSIDETHGQPFYFVEWNDPQVAQAMMQWRDQTLPPSAHEYITDKGRWLLEEFLYPISPDTIPWSEEEQEYYRTSKIAQGLPADYTEADPLDVAGMQNLIDDLHTDWWHEPEDRQRQAIANAFRATMVSPRQNLKWNSIVYQDLMHVPPHESNPDTFEQTIRDRKGKWDRFGQQTFDMIQQNTQDPEHIDYGQNLEKYQPGIWGNIRGAGSVGPYVEQIRQAALEDIAAGGDGHIFRDAVLDMNIPGVGPKVASFAWLMLNPKSSRLATVDVHMMRALGQESESPRDTAAYRQFEQQLEQQKNAMGYQDVPLGAYQWALWDKTRTPGYHQDHTPLRPLDPVDWRNIDWAPTKPRTRSGPPDVHEEQQPLFANWKRTTAWTKI